MTYQTRAAAYADPTTRGRIDVCATEQAHVYVNDGRPDIAALADEVIARTPLHLSALAASVCASPNGDALDDDGALLAAMQAVWPAVAAALYVAPPPEEIPTGTWSAPQIAGWLAARGVVLSPEALQQLTVAELLDMVADLRS